MEEEKNTSPFQFVNKEEIEEKIEKEEPTNKQVIAEDFVTGLPEWDLTPPYEVIRRVNRK